MQNHSQKSTQRAIVQFLTSVWWYQLWRKSVPSLSTIGPSEADVPLKNPPSATSSSVIVAISHCSVENFNFYVKINSVLSLQVAILSVKCQTLLWRRSWSPADCREKILNFQNMLMIMRNGQKVSIYNFRCLYIFNAMLPKISTFRDTNFLILLGIVEKLNIASWCWMFLFTGALANLVEFTYILLTPSLADFLGVFEKKTPIPLTFVRRHRRGRRWRKQDLSRTGWDIGIFSSPMCFWHPGDDHL